MTNRFALAALALAGAAAISLPASASYRLVGSGEDAQVTREAPTTIATPQPRQAGMPSGTPVLIGSGDDAEVVRR